ncbi:ELMO CED-12 family protein [Musa troglodytarum]|nr:ELMO CED-12 family protein [Musa troglodytarum]
MKLGEFDAETYAIPLASLKSEAEPASQHRLSVTGDAMVGNRSWFGGVLYRIGNKRQSSNEKTIDYTLTPLQEARLQKLKERLNVPFDEARPDHQEALRALWHASFPRIELTGLVSEQWKDMGWQGPNPSTDFR